MSLGETIFRGRRRQKHAPRLFNVSENCVTPVLDKYGECNILGEPSLPNKLKFFCNIPSFNPQHLNYPLNPPPLPLHSGPTPHNSPISSTILFPLSCNLFCVVWLRFLFVVVWYIVLNVSLQTETPRRATMVRHIVTNFTPVKSHIFLKKISIRKAMVCELYVLISVIWCVIS
jgi:hypothetical protein